MEIWIWRYGYGYGRGYGHGGGDGWYLGYVYQQARFSNFYLPSSVLFLDLYLYISISFQLINRIMITYQPINHITYPYVYLTIYLSIMNLFYSTVLMISSLSYVNDIYIYIS